MKQCHICQSFDFQETFISETFQIEGQVIRVEGIPATRCCQCEELNFSTEVTEKIRYTIYEGNKNLLRDGKIVFSEINRKHRRIVGSMKGTFILPLPNNFDAPLEEFKEYM